MGSSNSKKLSIETEPIGSVPRSEAHIKAMSGPGDDLKKIESQAVKDTMKALSALSDDVLIITDGEQTKPSFATYPIHGLTNIAPGGVTIPFEDGHTRQLPLITSGPFCYANWAVDYLKIAKKAAKRGQPIKQAVISASAMSLLYPPAGLENYSQEQFIEDVVKCAVRDVRQCLDAGADVVQMDFTEARLSLKLDPSGGLLQQFVDLNNRVFDAFPNEADAKRLGVHVCPGADHDSAHSADILYQDLIPTLFKMRARRFYMQFKSEKDHEAVLACIKENLKPGQLVFIGVTDVNSPRVETPDEVAELVKLAAQYIPKGQLGTCDDCGFSPFADDVSTSRDIAFEKMRSRISGTKMAAEALKF